MRFENMVFVKSATGTSGFIRDGLPQIVLAGRSNVGKSSLLNCLARRKLLARTSATPGKTAMVNYFIVDSAFYAVDLPGYGYAKVSHAEQERWGTMMSEFFSDVSATKLGLLVVDIRHKPTAQDKDMARLFRDLGIPFAVAANKRDKLSAAQAEAGTAVIRQVLELGDEPCIAVSAEKGTGRDDVIDTIGSYIV
jgi:GTP-binding protein